MLYRSATHGFDALAPHFPHPCQVPWAVTANMALRHTGDVKFDLRFPPAGGGEDVDFCLRLAGARRMVALPKVGGMMDGGAHSALSPLCGPPCTNQRWPAHQRAPTCMRMHSIHPHAPVCARHPTTMRAQASVTHPWWDGGARCYSRFFRWAWGDGELVDLWARGLPPGQQPGSSEPGGAEVPPRGAPVRGAPAGGGSDRGGCCDGGGRRGSGLSASSAGSEGDARCCGGRGRAAVPLVYRVAPSAAELVALLAWASFWALLAAAAAGASLVAAAAAGGGRACLALAARLPRLAWLGITAAGRAATAVAAADLLFESACNMAEPERRACCPDYLHLLLPALLEAWVIKVVSESGRLAGHLSRHGWLARPSGWARVGARFDWFCGMDPAIVANERRRALLRFTLQAAAAALALRARG
jgi:hypothetical protein